GRVVAVRRAGVAGGLPGRAGGQRGRGRVAGGGGRDRGGQHGDGSGGSLDPAPAGRVRPVREAGARRRRSGGGGGGRRGGECEQRGREPRRARDGGLVRLLGGVAGVVDRRRDGDSAGGAGGAGVAGTGLAALAA